VVAVNIPGVRPGQLKLSASVVADIYLGKVQSWSDPKIAALNANLKLPDAKIVPVRRADGSGTTFHFTGYLSRASTEWKEKVGSDLLVKWPAGEAARGNEGVANTVKRTANAIGYVEFAQAMRSQLTYALIENRAGKYVEPSAQAFQQSAARADWKSAPDFYLQMSEVTAEDAYPLVATVFILMPRDGAPRRMRATLDFFRWALEKGAKDTVVGYVPLPEALVKQVKEYWAKSLKGGA
jgi:phosphate transport system substrate-binding protein